LVQQGVQQILGAIDLHSGGAQFRGQAGKLRPLPNDAEDGTLLRLADGLIHRPLWTVLTLAGTARAVLELARWIEQQDRKRRAIEKGRVAMRLKKPSCYP
jgi:hypothetical protein